MERARQASTIALVHVDERNAYSRVAFASSKRPARTIESSSTRAIDQPAPPTTSIRANIPHSRRTANIWISFHRLNSTGESRQIEHSRNARKHLYRYRTVWRTRISTLTNNTGIAVRTGLHVSGNILQNVSISTPVSLLVYARIVRLVQTVRGDTNITHYRSYSQ